jgi:hypothetical protein
MSYQNISYVIPAADLAAINAAFDTLNAKLPFLITLTKEEHQTLFKMGNKSVDFVQDAAEASKAFPTILPANFSQAEYLKDTDLVKNLVTIKVKLDSLQEKVDDTLMAVGSEAMGSSLEVYSLVQIQADRVPGLKSVADNLKARFKKSKSKQAPVSSN